MPQEPQTSPGSLVGEEYEVEVGPVAHGGHCVARTEAGRVLFVRHTLPGERVVARVTHGDETSRFLRADAVEILEKSGQKFEYPVEWGANLQTEHERFLTEEHFESPVTVFNYPKSIKPFYMRTNDDEKTVTNSQFI